MTINNSEKAREMTSWFKYPLGKRRKVLLNTNNSIEDEIFASLEYFTEIESVGIEFLRERGVANPKNNFKTMQAFVRQAKTFYLAGKKLHFRASPLMYYYSFLNLVKAYILLSDSRFLRNTLSHGLYQKNFAAGPLSLQTLSLTKKKGVFHKFYELERYINIPNSTKLSISSMFAYCSDVAHEFVLSGWGASKILPVKMSVFSHRGGRISWPMMVIANFSVLAPYKKSLSPFFRYFHMVKPDRNMINKVFDISAEFYSGYTYFESLNTYSWTNDDHIKVEKILSDVRDALSAMYESPIYDDENDFNISVPLRVNNQLPFSEPLAIYVLMFYIGSLVRYRPDYLEKLLSSKDAWIVERFVRGSAVTFLRYIGNAILGKDYIYTAR